MPNGGPSIDTLRLAIAANPNDPFAWYALGVHCYIKKMHQEALQCFERAESCKKNFSAANFYYIALTQRAMGRIDDCMESLRRAANTRAINTVDKKGRALAEKMLAKMENRSSPSPSKDPQAPAPTPVPPKVDAQ